MALQDLTPQLRTRLSRLEWLVGLFITVATVLMLTGFGFYIHQMAERKGWRLVKAPYFTYLRSAAGLKEGDTVKLMGFDVGEITKITAEDPNSPYDVYVEFVIRFPYYGYLWNDSVVRVKSAGLLGTRYLEVTKGGSSGTTDKLYATYRYDLKTGRLLEIYTGHGGLYTNYVRGTKWDKYYLPADEPAELSAQLDQIVQTAKAALPNLLALTNRIEQVLTQANAAVARAEQLLTAAQPLVTNLTVISANLREPRGSLGEWLIPTNIAAQLTQTLASAQGMLDAAHTAVTNTDQRLELVVNSLVESLENLAGITSNLHAQVQANTNLVTSVNRAIIDADDFIQGLKRHWLLRSAFRTPATNVPSTKPSRVVRPPKLTK